MNPGRMRSVDATRFSMVPRNDVPRSAFDVNFIHKTTFQGGALIPIYVDEVLPGDSLRLNMTAFVRLATPIVPVMDNLRFETFFFFVPNRLLWSNWERFMGEQANPSDTTVFLTPYVDVPPVDLVPGSIADYFGITNNNSVNNMRVQSMPFRAYNLIFNDWFRDQDLTTPLTVDTSDGPDTWANYALRSRAQRHDYFTSARPWPLKPLNMDIASTLDGTPRQGGPFNMALQKVGAPVSGLAITVQTTSAGGTGRFETGSRNQTYDNEFVNSAAAYRIRASGVNGFPDVKVMIDDFRTANMVAQMMERAARGGSRYTEIIRSHFGVVSPDARLQRPEYLGGGRTMVTMTPVAQSSATGLTGGTTPAGNLSAVGTAVATRHGFSASFTEHGWIIGLGNVQADPMYQQGVERMWFRRTQFDFYWPGLAHLGEQSILSREIFADGSASDTQIFGFQERWAEYKYKPSRTSGMFRSIAATPLDMWHFGIEYGSRPALNDAFVRSVAPIDRALQVSGYYNQQFLMDSLFEARWVRCMPMFSVPGLGSRF